MGTEQPVGKRDKFVRLAEKRTSNALRTIRLIGNLSNKTHYDYREGDIKKILSALTKEIDDLKRRFEDTGDKSNIEFRL